MKRFLIFFICFFSIIFFGKTAFAESLEFDFSAGTSTAGAIANSTQWFMSATDTTQPNPSTWAWFDDNFVMKKYVVWIKNIDTSAINNLTFSPKWWGYNSLSQLVACSAVPQVLSWSAGEIKEIEFLMDNHCHINDDPLQNTSLLPLQKFYRLNVGGTSNTKIKPLVYTDNPYGPTTQSCYGAQPNNYDLSLRVYGEPATGYPQGGLSAWFYLPIYGTSKTSDEWGDFEFIAISNVPSSYPDADVRFDVQIKDQGGTIRYDKINLESNFTQESGGVDYYAWKGKFSDFIFADQQYDIGVRSAYNGEWSDYAFTRISSGAGGPVFGCTGSEPFYTYCFWANMLNRLFVPSATGFGLSTWSSIIADINDSAPWCYSKPIAEGLANMNVNGDTSLIMNIPLTYEQGKPPVIFPLNFMPTDQGFKTAYDNNIRPLLVFMCYLSLIGYIWYRIKDITTNLS